MKYKKIFFPADCLHDINQCIHIIERLMKYWVFAMTCKFNMKVIFYQKILIINVIFLCTSYPHYFKFYCWSCLLMFADCLALIEIFKWTPTLNWNISYLQKWYIYDCYNLSIDSHLYQQNYNSIILINY